MAQEMLNNGSSWESPASTSSPLSARDRRVPINTIPASDRQLALIQDLMSREAQEEEGSVGERSLGSEEREGNPAGFRKFLDSEPTVSQAQALVEQLLERQKARRASRRREAELSRVSRKEGRRRGEPPSDLVI